jgi:hypothetical protein
MAATLAVIPLRISARSGISTRPLRTPNSRVAGKLDYQHCASLLLITTNYRKLAVQSSSEKTTAAGSMLNKPTESGAFQIAWMRFRGPKIWRFPATRSTR